MARTAISPRGITLGGINGNISVNPVNQTVGAGTQVGGVNVGVGGGPQGITVGGSTQVGDVGVGAGYNVNTGTVGVNAGTNVGDANVGVGVGVGAGGVQVGPSLTFGDSKEAGTGAAVGSTAGAVVGSVLLPGIGTVAGSFIGGALGSAVGGQFAGGPDTKQRKKRDSIFNAFRDMGLFNTDSDDYILPDGTTYSFNSEEKHSWKNPGKRVDGIGDRDLFSYEIDYTNDLDYTSGMVGLSLSRLLTGGKGREIDQVGSEMANGFLGKVGRGGELTKENFDNTMGNARSFYAKAGINSKDEMLALASQGHAQGRYNDTDFAVMQQAATMLFDNDFNTAAKLMAGRWKGVETAAKTPLGGEGGSQNRPGRIYSPQISSEEAALSVQPLLDKYRKGIKGSSGKAAMNFAQGVAAAAGIAKTLQSIDKLSGGTVKDLIKGAKDYFSDSPTDSMTFDTEGATYEDVTGGDPYTGFSGSDTDYQFPTDISYDSAVNTSDIPAASDDYSLDTTLDF